MFLFLFKSPLILSRNSQLLHTVCCKRGVFYLLDMQLMNGLKMSLQSTYTEAKFVNVSMGAFAAFSNSCDSLLSMLNDFDAPYNVEGHSSERFLCWNMV